MEHGSGGERGRENCGKKTGKVKELEDPQFLKSLCETLDIFKYPSANLILARFEVRHINSTTKITIFFCFRTARPQDRKVLSKPSQERHRNVHHQVLIESVDSHHHAAVASGLYKLSGESYKGSADNLHIVAFFKTFG